MKLSMLGPILLVTALLWPTSTGSPASRKLRKRKLIPRTVSSAFEPSLQGPIDFHALERSFSEEAEENESTTEGLIKEEVTKADKGISKGLMALKSEMAEAFGNILYDKYLKKYYKVLKEAVANNISEDANNRGAREEGSLGKLILDVMRVMVSDVIGLTVGNYMGYQTERTDSPSSFFDVFVNAVKKQTESKKMGCPL
eukprot:TRINITY_DN21911_c0_g1_i1.p1 TRINITY_DN21911_c0_g1~~TRINITY_DN21911_c0_g1_i1.p1  ORF type:complete len:199 (-),score=38.36 TRINITY_DN21911_c0_g1_i1:248-844(-)